MITLLKDRPILNADAYHHLYEPVSSFEDLQNRSYEHDSKCFIVNSDNPIIYTAFYNAGAKYWIVIPNWCPPFLEKALQFELDRTYKVRVD